jgi:hypothetical protein
MTQTQRIVCVVVAALLALAAPVLGGHSARAQSGMPFAASAPNGYSWWCNPEKTACVLLPAETSPGPQPRFFLVTPGNRKDALLIAWMGGGESVWQGGIKAASMEWQATLATGAGRRGLIGASSGSGWTFAAVSPEDQWAQVASVYNAILRGL